MPVYTFVCPACGVLREEIMGCHDTHELTCSVCGIDMNRHWQSDMPYVQGDTVAGCCNYSGFDTGLGCEVRSRTHRREIMAEKGLRECEPTPHVKEMLHQFKAGASRTPDGRASIDKIANEARDAQVKDGVERALGNTVKKHALKYMAGNAR